MIGERSNAETATTKAPWDRVVPAMRCIADGHGVGRPGIEPGTRGLKGAPEPFQGMLDFPD